MRLPAFCVVFVLLGCSGERVSQSVVRDSAGIRIVEHNNPDWSRLSWSLADSPTVAIGTMDGEEPYQLHTVSDAARAGNGQILILNTSTSEVRVFDAKGRYLRSLGRRGQGPGEFRYPTEIRVLADDSVMVWDAPLGPRVFFNADGVLARMEAVDRSALMAQLGEGRATEDVRLMPDNRLLTAAWRVGRENDTPNNQLFRPPFELVLLAPDLASSVSLGTYGGIEQMFIANGERRAPATVLFSPHFQIAAGGTPQRIVLGNGDRYDLRVHDAAGALQQIIRRSGPPNLVTDADRDSILGVRRAFAEKQNRRPELERSQSALPEQKYFPAHGPLLVDLLGNILGAGIPAAH